MAKTKEGHREGFQPPLISIQEIVLGELAPAHTADGLPLFGPGEETEYILRGRLIRERGTVIEAPRTSFRGQRGRFYPGLRYQSAADEIERSRHPAESRRQSYVARGRR